MSAQVQLKKKPLSPHKKSSNVVGVQLDKPAGVGNIMKKLDAEIKKSKEGKLPPVFKKKWLEALRSGKFEQIDGSLARKHTKTEMEMGAKQEWGFCVLGVAAKVAGYSNDKVRRAGGNIPERFEKVPSLLREDHEMSHIADGLMDMNDTQKKSFTEIADYIEREL